MSIYESFLDFKSPLILLSLSDTNSAEILFKYEIGKFEHKKEMRIPI